MAETTQKLTDGAGNTIDFKGELPELVDGERNALRAIYHAPERVTVTIRLLKELDGFDDPAQEIQFLERLGLIKRFGPGTHTITPAGCAAIGH